jgi:hypothetical protein
MSAACAGQPTDIDTVISATKRWNRIISLDRMVHPPVQLDGTIFNINQPSALWLHELAAALARHFDGPWPLIGGTWGAGSSYPFASFISGKDMLKPRQCLYAGWEHKRFSLEIKGGIAAMDGPMMVGADEGENPVSRANTARRARTRSRTSAVCSGALFGETPDAEMTAQRQASIIMLYAQLRVYLSQRDACRIVLSEKAYA